MPPICNNKSAYDRPHNKMNSNKASIIMGLYWLAMSRCHCKLYCFWAAPIKQTCLTNVKRDNAIDACATDNFFIVL